MAATIAALVLALAPVYAPADFLAGTGDAAAGKGRNTAAATASCVVDGRTVTGTGLPTDQVLNFFVSDRSGKTGWVLGFTDTGSWPVTVPSRDGQTTYEFGSRTWGPNGTRYTVFASCTGY